MVVYKAMRLDPKACDMIQLLRDHQIAGDWIAESPMDDPGYIYSGSRPDGLASHDLSHGNAQIRQNSPNHVTD
jgi:hypothetical protein